MENSNKIIYVCDDDKDILDLIKMYLENASYEVVTFGDAESLIKGISKKVPDLITLDIMLPGMDGFSALENIRKKSDVPIILVSAKDTEIDKVRGFNEGSDDYIVKPFMPLELVARVKNVLRRLEGNNEKVVKKKKSKLEFANLVIDNDSLTISINKKEVSFTNIEYKFLYYMISNSHAAITKKEILKEVWGYEEDDGRVIDDLLKRLRKKLEEAKSKAVIETIWGVGYRIKDASKK